MTSSERMRQNKQQLSFAKEVFLYFLAWNDIFLKKTKNKLKIELLFFQKLQEFKKQNKSCSTKKIRKC